MGKETEKVLKYLEGVSPLARNRFRVIYKIIKCCDYLIKHRYPYIQYNHDAVRWFDANTGYRGSGYVFLSSSTVYTDETGEKSPVNLAEWLPAPTDSNVRYMDVIETVSGWAHEILTHQNIAPKTISIDDALRGFVRI